MKKFLFILLFFFSSCGYFGTWDPVSSSHYWVANLTGSTIYLHAEYNWGNGVVSLETNTIASGQSNYIYTFTEGSGGHTFPSNIFSEFFVYSSLITSNIIYQGINNSDWQDIGNSILLLTVN